MVKRRCTDLAQPLQVLRLEDARMVVQRVARRVVVVIVVHPACDGGVVVAQHGEAGHLAHDAAALVRPASVAHDVAEAVDPLDVLILDH